MRNINKINFYLTILLAIAFQVQAFQVQAFQVQAEDAFEIPEFNPSAVELPDTPIIKKVNLPGELQSKIPDIDFIAINWSSIRENSSVIIKKGPEEASFREGAELARDVLLIKINPRDVILETEGVQYEVGVVGSGF